MSHKSTLTSYGKTDHDALPLPGGATIGSAPSETILRQLTVAGVPGVSAENGRAANAAAYATHLSQIRQNAADAAVQEWLAGAAQ